MYVYDIYIPEPNVEEQAERPNSYIHAPFIVSQGLYSYRL